MAYTKSKEPLARLQQCYATVHEIHAHVEKTKISTVSLDPADIESILQTLIYDNKLQSKVDPDTGERLYKVGWRMLSDIRATMALGPFHTLVCQLITLFTISLL